MFKYFVAYYTVSTGFINTEIELDKRIETMQDIRDLEDALEGKDVIILGYNRLMK